jgi:hypothetical protein
VRRPSPFSFDGPVPGLPPKEFRRELDVSKRTLDSYYKRPGFPQGSMERWGRVLVRVHPVDDVPAAHTWMIRHGLPGGRANKARLDRLEDARSVKLARMDLGTLALHLVYVAGAEVLVETLRPLGYADRGLRAIPKDQVSSARAAITRAIGLYGGRP